MQMQRAVESEKERKVLKGIRRVEEKPRGAHKRGFTQSSVHCNAHEICISPANRFHSCRCGREVASGER